MALQRIRRFLPALGVGSAALFHWSVPPFAGTTVPRNDHHARCEQGADGDEKSLLEVATELVLSKDQVAVWQTVASSMKNCTVHMGPWSLGDFAFGLKAIADRQEEQGVQDGLDGHPLKDLSQLEELLEDARIADAVYEDSRQVFAELTILEEDDIVQFVKEADHFRTAYAIAVVPHRKEVLLVIRGTSSVPDALTDLAGAMVEFALGGHTHDGIHKCAQWLLSNEVDTLAGLLEDNPGYSLKLVGHSLGAGTAALLGLMIHDNAEVSAKLGGDTLKCITFAAPPVVSKDLAMECSDYITSVVCQDDLVPRASLANFEDLRKEIISCNWEKELKIQVGAERLGELAVSTSETLDSVLPVVPITDAVKAVGGVLNTAAEKMDLPDVQGSKEAIEKDMVRAKAVDKGNDVHGNTADEPESAKERREEADFAAKEIEDDKKSGDDEDAQKLREAAGPTDIPRLYVPGRLLYLSRNPGESCDAPKWALVGGNSPDQRFQRIVLSSSMLPDHLAGTYIEGLEAVLSSLDAEK